MQRMIIITGERQQGKSTLCRTLIEQVRKQQVPLSGVITRHTDYHSLEVEELKTGVRYPLTKAWEAANGPLKRFTIDGQAFERSAQAIRDSFPTQLFIVDEIGPLELEHHQGWYEAISLLRHTVWDTAILVIRPHLIPVAICELPAVIYTVVNVTEANRDALPARLRDAIIKGTPLDCGVGIST